jgi:hypothetical protein
VLRATALLPDQVGEDSKITGVLYEGRQIAQRRIRGYGSHSVAAVPFQWLSATRLSSSKGAGSLRI